MARCIEYVDMEGVVVERHYCGALVLLLRVEVDGLLREGRAVEEVKLANECD